MFNLFRAEVIKQGKTKLMLFVTLAPVVVSLLIGLILIIVKIAGGEFGGSPTDNFPNGPELGEGLFYMGSTIVLVVIGGLYSLGLVLLGSLVINSEYNFSTIKMLAIREASRSRLIVAKVWFMAAFALFMAVVVSLCWVGLTFVLKIIFDQPLSLTEQDGTALLYGLKYITVAFGLYLVWSLLGMALALRFKSLVAAVILYFIYSGIDGLASGMGALALKGSFADPPAFLAPLIEVLKVIAPFLLNTSYTRLAFKPTDPGFVESIPPVQSVIVLLAWGVIYTLLAIMIIRSRDITD